MPRFKTSHISELRRVRSEYIRDVGACEVSGVYTGVVCMTLA